jgi:integrase
MEAARSMRSKFIYPFLRIAFETGLRSGETRRLRWEQVVLGQTPETSQITVGQAKTAAGTGRVIPMTPTLWAALQEYAGWLAEKLGEPIRPDWYVFPFSSRVRPVDPTRPVTTIKTAWQEVREKAGVKARLHDARHTFISRLAEADISEITMKQLAGHVSKSMLERYSHIRMETKRAALEKALGKRDRAETSVGVPKVSPKVARKPTLQ